MCLLPTAYAANRATSNPETENDRVAGGLGLGCPFMFRIRTDNPSPPRPPVGDHLTEQMRRVLGLMDEVRRLCDAVEVMAPRYPERVRQQIIDRFNDVNRRIRRIQEATDGLRDIPPTLHGMDAAHRRLERRVEDTVAALERAQDARDDAGEASPVRQLSDEFEDQLDRGMLFGRVNRSYDGWRRRP